MITTLKNIAFVQMGHSFRARLEKTPRGNVAVIQMKDLSDDNRLDDRSLALVQMRKLKDSQRVRRNDLIFRSRGLNNRAVLVEREPGNAIVASPLLHLRVYGPYVLPTYLCWFINLPTSQAFLQSHATGTAMRMIGKKTLDALEVQIPSLSIQQRIIELSQLADREQNILQSLSAKRKQLVDSKLMHVIKLLGIRD